MTTIAPPAFAPKIFVSDLSAYNNGELHGVWIDIATDDVHDEIQSMLSSSPFTLAEEYAIHDYEGFGNYQVGEYQPVDEVIKIAEKIIKHGAAYVGWISVADADEIEDDDKFGDAFIGEFDSEDAYYEDLGETYVDSFKAGLDEATRSQFEAGIESAIDLVRYGKNLDAFDVRFAKVLGPGTFQVFAYRRHV